MRRPELTWREWGVACACFLAYESDRLSRELDNAQHAELLAGAAVEFRLGIVEALAELPPSERFDLSRKLRAAYGDYLVTLARARGETATVLDLFQGAGNGQDDPGRVPGVRRTESTGTEDHQD